MPDSGLAGYPLRSLGKALFLRFLHPRIHRFHLWERKIVVPGELKLLDGAKSKREIDIYGFTLFSIDFILKKKFYYFGISAPKGNMRSLVLFMEHKNRRCFRIVSRPNEI